MPFLLFDFDGTIAQTFEAFVEAYNSIASFFFCKRITSEDISYVRSHDMKEYLGHFGVRPWKVAPMIFLIKRKLKKAMLHVPPVEGILSLLKRLHKEGFDMAIMSSNSESNIRMFLKKYDIEHLFQFVHSGKNIFGKDKVIESLIGEHGLVKRHLLYIGDETRDIRATKKINVPMIAVSWGFTASELLASLEPYAVVESPQELRALVTQFCNDLS